MSASGHSQNNWGKNNPKCTFEKPGPGLFLYLVLIPKLCTEIVCVLVCFLRALFKTGLKQTALQEQETDWGFPDLFFTPFQGNPGTS